MKKLKVLELFAGTRSIGKAFEKKGHEVYSVDIDKQHKDIDWYMDIENINPMGIIRRFDWPDIIWASPDCTTYSIAGIRHHRKKVNGDYIPISDYAKKSDRVMKNLLFLVKWFEVHNNTIFFIENPRGVLRKIPYMSDLKRHTVTYCQYGDFRMKPTDIWTNHPNPIFREMCKNGQPCHVSAPRGSQTGTQGINCVIDRSRIPSELCDDIVTLSEGGKPTLKQYKHINDKEGLNGKYQ